MYLSVISGVPNYLLLFAVSSFLSSFCIASKSILRNAYLIQLPSHFKQKSHVTFTLVSWSDIMETNASLLYIFNSPECFSTQHIEFHVFAGGPYEIQRRGLYDPSPILPFLPAFTEHFFKKHFSLLSFTSWDLTKYFLSRRSALSVHSATLNNCSLLSFTYHLCVFTISSVVIAVSCNY